MLSTRHISRFPTLEEQKEAERDAEKKEEGIFHIEASCVKEAEESDDRSFDGSG